MFPVGDDDVRNAGPALVTWGMIAVNVLVFVYQLTLGRGQLEPFFRTYGVVPAQILDGHQLYTLVTSMFLHGGWAHILSNMVFLAVFGDNVETTLGKLGYIAFYLAGGIVASVAHLLINSASTVPSLGASGALAAILGAYIVMFPRSRVRVLVFFGFTAFFTRVTAILFLGVWFISQLFSGVASLGVETAQTAGVAYWAHIGGFVLGLLVGFLARGQAPDLVRRRRS